ncbi:hypothetical protein [Methanosarcina horonobensis]|uniref:hypothetical protein n=1 Tax=Methanosarcina horonobensis TaxID=418008 RepID=UPI000AD6B483
MVLNKAPYEDRMDEIIVDGEVLASIRFEIESCEWVLLPRLEGARRLFQGRDKKDLKKWVVIEEEILPFILKKKGQVFWLPESLMQTLKSKERTKSLS